MGQSKQGQACALIVRLPLAFNGNVLSISQATFATYSFSRSFEQDFVVISKKFYGKIGDLNVKMYKNHESTW